MKKILFTLLGCMVLSSCTNEVEQMVTNREEMHDVLSVIEEENSNVTLTDIQAYMDKGSVIASRNGGDGDIEVITYQNDTVMYLLKYADGWEMMPSDKRFPLRVAYNDEGTLDYTNMHDAQRAWFESMAEEIHVMKKQGKGIENEYCKVWNALTKKSKKKDKSISRGNNGEWIYHNTREESTITEKPHLITTAWHQGVTGPLQFVEAYNIFCPIQSNGLYNKPAGCTAVAGGQVLFYFYKQGWSLAGIPNVATPNSNMSEYSYTEPTNAVWNYVQLGYTNAIAKLLGHIGFLSNMTYYDDKSEATLAQLTDALLHYGVDGTLQDSWDITKMRNNLSSNLPVIVSMAGVDNKYKRTAHSLIVDGYKQITTRYTDVYIYIEDPNSYQGDMYDHDEGMNPVPEEGPTQEDTYTTSAIYLYVNWGDGVIDNTSYLASNHLSHTKVDKETNQVYNVIYNMEKKMLYDLRVLPK